MTSISFDHVSKVFSLYHQRTLKELIPAWFKKKATTEQHVALRDVTFSIQKGESVGIIGHNGAGKSTILKMIAGVSTPSQGSVSIHGQVAPLIELGAGFHPELTGRENIFLNGVIMGMKEKYIHAIFDQIVAFAELEEYINTPIKHYSSGMYMRLAFSVATHIDPEILLIDEILAVGDVAFQEKCMQKMRDFQKNKVTIVYVSHDMDTVQDFCQRVIYLKNGQVSFDGDTKTGTEMYLKDMHEQKLH